MKKRLISLLLVCALVISGSINTFADTEITGQIVPTSAQSSVINADNIINKQYVVRASVDRIEFTRDTPVGSAMKINSTTSVQPYVKETAIIIPNNKAVGKKIMAQLAGGSKTEHEIDTTNTVTIYNTVKYNRVTGYLSQSYIAMTKITGYFTISGADGTTIAEQWLRYGQTGFSSVDGSFVGDQTGTSYPSSTSSSSWSQSIPANWEAVLPETMGTVGCTYRVTMQRPNGYQWTVQVINHIT